MRSRNNAPFLLVAVGIAALGGFSLQLLGNAAQSSATRPASRRSNQGSEGTVIGGTHSEVQPHAPNVQSAGDYHIEAQLSPSGQLELYVYGQKERELHPISTMGLDLLLEAKAVLPGESSVDIPMQANPYSTDPDGMSSRFVGRFDRRPDQGEVGLTVAIPIAGKTYRVQWRPEYLRSGPFALAADPPMPQAVSSQDADRLFLTPGGLYTAADIEANGRMTAQKKYGSQMSAHNAHPKTGDRLCPITDTLANPKFAWVIGGKTYLFCCPPCIEEFVKQAKETPTQIKAPEQYVMRP
jgi:YHS domain-containing protein